VQGSIPEEIDLEQVDIWFQDEARVGQQGTVTRLWAVKGTRPRVVRQQQFNYTYIFGAVCPSRDEAVGLVMPYANTNTMQIHLEHISMKIPNGRHAVVVLDQAGWHTTGKLKRFKNITLISLPPASPELNPTEQVWRQLREGSLANRCFKDEEDIVNACCEAWNNFDEKVGAVKSLCSREWASLIG
jgi:transposase